MSWSEEIGARPVNGEAAPPAAIESVQSRREKREADERAQFARAIAPVDMAAELAKPPRTVRYRVEGFAQDGALTIVAGAAGAGKSWFGMQACAAVQRGDFLGGLGGPLCSHGAHAVYVDGEMGRHQMVDRFRAAGFAADAFSVLDVQGLDLGQGAGIDALHEALVRMTPRVRFVVIDSLRRLTPGKRENDSDDMAPVVADLALMARRLDAAIVLLHHSGHGEHFARGSTAIGDQADAVFGYVVEDEVRRLTCNPGRGGKFRFGREPEDRFFRHEIGERDGAAVVACDKAPSTTTGALDRVAEYGQRIEEMVAAEPMTQREIAESLGVHVDNKSVRWAVANLANRGLIEQDERLRWCPVVVAAAYTGGTTTGPGEMGGEA